MNFFQNFLGLLPADSSINMVNYRTFLASCQLLIFELLEQIRGRFTGDVCSQLSYTPMVLKPLILLDFCVIQLSCSAGGFTGRLPSQLSYTPRCGKEHLLSFVEGCVTASTGLPAELYPHICDATGPPCSTQVISYQKPCGLSTIKIKFFLFPKTYRFLSSRLTNS